MAKQIEGVYERILKCAKKEFLEKGFKDASLREIAKEASTSTGSIYTRFHDKNGLFGALVEPVVKMIHSMSNELETEFESRDAKTQEDTMGDYSLESHGEIIDFIYDNKESFILLLKCSYGSQYEHFADALIEMEEQSTMNFLKATGHADLLEKPGMLHFIHMLSTSYCSGIFEPLLHGLSRQSAHEYDKMFTRYHVAGFETLMKTETKAV